MQIWERGPSYYVKPGLVYIFLKVLVLQMVQEANIDGDQHVSFEEFSNIFNEG